MQMLLLPGVMRFRCEARGLASVQEAGGVGGRNAASHDRVFLPN
jgi:hypothetical protein